jgi:selT/selW/selH-like putative selenoprotein
VEEVCPEGALEIHFEVCRNCAQHAWCTHHDEKRYAMLYQEFKAAIKSSVPNSFVPKMNKYTPQPGTGAFEITHKGMVIFSKKKAGLFPVVAPTVERIKAFL